MKRTPMKPRTKGLKRSGMRRGRSQRSAKSGGHLFPANVDEAFRAWARQQPCAVSHLRTGMFWAAPWATYRAGCGTLGRIVVVVCAHLKSRGSGGVDHENIVPLDAWLHDQLGLHGRTWFERRWGVDLKAEALALWDRYQSEVGAARGRTP